MGWATMNFSDHTEEISRHTICGWNCYQASCICFQRELVLEAKLFNVER